ncbi:MAG: hypothetical protein ABI699_08685 [Caldimonas sp.]
MKFRHWYLTTASAVLVFSAMPLARAHDADARAESLGQVNFEVSCSAAAQKEFNVAMAYYYSFDWSKLDPALNRVLQLDPACGMAHWARALSMLDNTFNWPGGISAKALIEGPKELHAARRTGLKTQRERDYVEATSVFFKDHDKTDHHTRAKAFEVSLEKLAKLYPSDDEASVLYALLLSSNFDPADKKYTNQMRAAEILEPIFLKQPQHPGVAHFLIHSYDYPPLAQKGLETARRYAKIAPSAPHALHMPSHIFTLLGQWRESVASNLAARAAARPGTQQAFHASDYMIYAYLQLGETDNARQVLEQARAASPVDTFGVAYPYAAMPARIAIENAAWKEAAELPLYPAADAYPWQKYPQAEALNAFARGIGAAMNNEPAKAYAEVKRLTLLRDAAAALKEPYWADQVDIQVEVVRGLAMTAEGKHKEGIEVLRKAADREDGSAKHVVTPGPVVRARQMLATMIDKYGNPAEALSEYEKVLLEQPELYAAVVGAVRNAKRMGDAQKTAIYNSKLGELRK